MATLTSNAAAGSAPTKAIHAGVQAATEDYTVSTTLATGDIIQMVKVPKGARIIGGHVAFNLTGTPNLPFSLGDGGDADRFMTSTTVNSTAAFQAFNSSVMDHDYTDDDTIDLTVGTVTAAPTGGTITVTVLYQMDS